MIFSRLRNWGKASQDLESKIQTAKTNWDNYLNKAAFQLAVIGHAERNLKKISELYDKGEASLDQLNEAKRAYNIAQNGKKDLERMNKALEIQFNKLPKWMRRKLKAAGVQPFWDN
jgi:hypothetical protein